jgi:hypothetical protein
MCCDPSLGGVTAKAQQMSRIQEKNYNTVSSKVVVGPARDISTDLIPTWK